MEKHKFMPKRDMADGMIGFELMLWSNSLEGKTFESFEELKKECPEVEILGSKKRFEEFGAYEMINESKLVKEKLAYKCPYCNLIIGGPPSMKKENSMGVMPLTGRLAVLYNCKKCHLQIGDHTIACS